MQVVASSGFRFHLARPSPLAPRPSPRVRVPSAELRAGLRARLLELSRRPIRAAGGAPSPLPSNAPRALSTAKRPRTSEPRPPSFSSAPKRNEQNTKNAHTHTTTQAFLWHTITIDEGHRLKNEAAKLCASLARVKTPFRLLLTGTPLQVAGRFRHSQSIASRRTHTRGATNSVLLGYRPPPSSSRAETIKIRTTCTSSGRCSTTSCRTSSTTPPPSTRPATRARAARASTACASRRRVRASLLS